MPEAPENNTPRPAGEQPAANEQPSQANTPPPVAGRPAPEFGEYAPEGWEWTPAEPAAPAGAGAAESTDRPAGGAPAAPAPAAQSPVPQNMPGVPHNLGAGVPVPGRKGRTAADGAARSETTQSGAPGATQSFQQPQQTQQTQQQGGTPYRAPAPQQPQQPRYVPQPGLGTAGQRPARPADRIITIVLLVFGGVSALRMASEMFNIDSLMRVSADQLKIDTITPPVWLAPTATVFGLVVLAFYGLVLVYSIRRLRAAKLTFWVPLVAGAIVGILMTVLLTVALFNTPEVMSVLTDPKQAAEFLENV